MLERIIVNEVAQRQERLWMDSHQKVLLEESDEEEEDILHSDSSEDSFIENDEI
jgi:hypothetical protein